MSKFKGLIDDIKEKQAGGTVAEEIPDTPPALPSPAAETPKKTSEKRKPGRPKVGKSSNPDYVQTTSYVERLVHTGVQKELLDMKPTD